MPSSRSLSLLPLAGLPGECGAAADSSAPATPFPRRVVAAVCNSVTSDNRALRISASVQREGFESVAVGIGQSGDALQESHTSGVAIRRALAKPFSLSFLLLCGSVLTSRRSLRETLEAQYAAPAGLPDVKPAAPGAPSPASSPFPAPRMQPHSRPWTSPILDLLSALRARWETARLKAYLAEMFRQLYPLLLSSKPDIIHAHDLSALLPAVMAGRKLRVPVVYDSHELEFDRNSSWHGHTIEFWTAHERDLIPFVDGIIAVSEGCAQALRQRYRLAPETVVVARNCPAEPSGVPGKGLREVTGLSADTPLLIFVGKITRNRGLELLLEILPLLPGFCLACVGPEDSSYRRSLEAAAVRHRIRDRVFFLQSVPSNEVIPFISQADVSVMPIRDACLSYRYCLPNKLFESAHAGLPIVSSSLPDMQAFIETYRIGTSVASEEPSAWADAIQSAYLQRASYYTPEKAARIRRECSAGNEAAKVASLYRLLLSESLALPA